MKNKVSIIFLFILLQNNFVISQMLGWEFIHSEVSKEIGNLVIENDQGNYIVASEVISSSIGNTRLQIFELDNEGSIIAQLMLEKEEYSIGLLSLFQQGAFYLGIGYANDPVNSTGNLLISKFDLDLQIVQDTIIYLGSDRLGDMNCNIINDTIFCVGNRFDTGFSKPFGFKLSTYNDIHLIKADLLPFNNRVTSLIYNPIDSNYVVLGQNRLLLFDYDFNYKTTLSLPFSLSQQGQIIAELNSFLVTGKSDFIDPTQPNSRDIGLARFSYSYEPLSLITIGMSEDSIDIPAPKNSISFIDSTHFYLGGTFNMQIAPFETVSDNSWFGLSKFDTELNKIWERSYGGDAFYIMYSLSATSDGGCIMVGLRQEHWQEEVLVQLYVLKVDENGEIVSTSTIPIQKEIATVYPNPFQDYFQIDISEKLLSIDDLKLELVDMNGRVVIQQDIKDKNIKLSTSNVSVGNYIVIIKDKNDNVIWQDKLVKGL